MPENHPLIETRAALTWDDITACIIVDPDLQSWMPTELANGQLEQIISDLDEDAHAEAFDALYPQIWIGAIDDESALFVAHGRFTPIHIHGYLEDDESLWDFLRDLAAGIARREPTAVFALWGATRENEVAKAAQILAEAGLRAVIMEPWCISQVMFHDKDEATAAGHQARAARRVLLGDDSEPWDALFADIDDEADDEED